jgi:hypothetical protein
MYTRDVVKAATVEPTRVVVRLVLKGFEDGRTVASRAQ